jgi:hypothetical protein
MDCVVKSWIVTTLIDNLGEIIPARSSTAYHAWLTVESQFLGNREACSIHLETRFLNFVQGDLSVMDYCHKLKKMADDLSTLGRLSPTARWSYTSFGASTSGSTTSAHSFAALVPSPPSWRLVTTSSLRNSHWGTMRPLPLPFCLLRHPPTLLHHLQAPTKLAPPRMSTVAATSAVVAAKAAPTQAPTSGGQ